MKPIYQPMPWGKSLISIPDKAAKCIPVWQWQNLFSQMNGYSKHLNLLWRLAHYCVYVIHGKLSFYNMCCTIISFPSSLTIFSFYIFHFKYPWPLLNTRKCKQSSSLQPLCVPSADRNLHTYVGVMENLSPASIIIVWIPSMNVSPSRDRLMFKMEIIIVATLHINMHWKKGRCLFATVTQLKPWTQHWSSDLYYWKIRTSGDVITHPQPNVNEGLII